MKSIVSFTFGPLNNNQTNVFTVCVSDHYLIIIEIYRNIILLPFFGHELQCEIGSGEYEVGTYKPFPSF